MSLKNKVEYILEKYPQARNCDNSLVACFIWEYYRDDVFDNKVDLKAFKTMPNFYDLVRYRKIIQNKEGKYLPSPEILQKRFNKQIDKRIEMGSNPEFVYPMQTDYTGKSTELTPREEKTIELRKSGKTFREIADEFGVTMERARQIFYKAEEKLKIN